MFVYALKTLSQFTEAFQRWSAQQSLVGVTGFTEGIEREERPEM